MARLFFWASAWPARPLAAPAPLPPHFMLILLWLSRQPGQDGLGLSHDLLDHQTGGLDHVDQPRRLPAGAAPAPHVPPRPGQRGSVGRHPPPPESARARPPAPYAPRPRAPGRSPHPPRWPRGPWLASRSRRAPSPSSRADAPRRSPAPDSRARRSAPAPAPPASLPPR